MSRLGRGARGPEFIAAGERLDPEGSLLWGHWLRADSALGEPGIGSGSATAKAVPTGLLDCLSPGPELCRGR